MVKFLRKKIPSCFLLALATLVVNVTNAGSSSVVLQQTDTTSQTFRPLLVDDNHEPIANAVVTNMTTSQSAKSDKSGVAELNANEGDLTEISLYGSVIITHTVTGNRSPVIVLSSKHPAVLQSKEIRLLNKTSLPGHLTAASTQAVYNNDITKMPVTSVRNALVGRLAGLYTNQSSGQPGADGVSLTIRGQSPIVIIDGIPRTLTIFDLEEIESVTVLKDALATAMLGVRGSNGALLITTRKGTPSKQRISFTVQSAFQQPLKMPEPVNAHQYALLHNEASVNSGLPVVYSDADIEGYLMGTDPYAYPNVDWRQQVLKTSSRFDRYTMNASGGNDVARYFVSLEHFNQTGLLKESDTNRYSTNNTLKSYTIRSNVDINVTPTLTAGIHLLGRILNGNEPGATANSIFNTFLITPNNAYPVFNRNGSYGGSQLYSNNIWAQAIGSGYRQNYKRDMLADFYLKRTLDEITPGLWLRASGSYYATISENIFRTKSFAVFQPSSPGSETYQQFGTNTTQINSNGIDYQGRADYLELALGYNRQFDSHGFNAIVLGNRDNAVAGSDLPYTITGLSGRISYNYKEKYIAEAAFGLNGSNWYPPKGDTRYGLFPAVGLGWNISKEDFLKDLTWLSQLKLYGSYGRNGQDNPGYFTYIQRYFDGAGAIFGTGAGFNTSINELTLANPNVTWEKVNKLNVGVQSALLDNRLSFTLEYYNMKYYDLLMQRGKNTSLLGNSYPNENIGSNRYTGWDFQLTWQQNIGQVNYFVAANTGIMNSEVLFMDEVYRSYDWMIRTGNRVGQPFGYIAEGLFQTQAEIDASATVDGYTPQPGDIKYRDLNSDGVINQFDEAPIGSQKPLFTYGINLGLSWRFIDFTALIQGVENRNIYLSGNTELAFQYNGFGQAHKHHLNRWTPENAANATHPRLSIGDNINNYAYSSYWMQSGDYLRLKFVEVGFTVPTNMLTRIKLESLRIFVNGTNLFTANTLERLDPEVYSGAYPIQRLINVGVNVKL